MSSMIWRLHPQLPYDTMTDKSDSSDDYRPNPKKKSTKHFRDDDAYGANKINKEFKRKKQYLKEEEDWENWSEEDKN